MKVLVNGNPTDMSIVNSRGPLRRLAWALYGMYTGTAWLIDHDRGGYADHDLRREVHFMTSRQ